MKFISKTLKCFNCDTKLKEKEAFTIKVDTLEGLHEMKMCEKCAKYFDEIMKQVEEIIDERDKPF
jgi:uncharacterized protein with PIN domain